MRNPVGLAFVFSFRAQHLIQDAYDLEEPSLDPDTFVVELNADVSQVDESLAGTVGAWERKSVNTLSFRVYSNDC